MAVKYAYETETVVRFLGEGRVHLRHVHETVPMPTNTFDRACLEESTAKALMLTAIRGGTLSDSDCDALVVYLGSWRGMLVHEAGTEDFPEALWLARAIEIVRQVQRAVFGL